MVEITLLYGMSHSQYNIFTATVPTALAHPGISNTAEVPTAQPHPGISNTATVPTALAHPGISIPAPFFELGKWSPGPKFKPTKY